jgi:hypothetical protein
MNIENRAKLSDKAFACLAMVERLSMSISNHQINDYGDSTGFCEEADAIWNELYETLGHFTARAARVTKRINKTQAEYAERAPQD